MYKGVFNTKIPFLSRFHMQVCVSYYQINLS